MDKRIPMNMNICDNCRLKFECFSSKEQLICPNIDGKYIVGIRTSFEHILLGVCNEEMDIRENLFIEEKELLDILRQYNFLKYKKRTRHYIEVA